MIRLLRHLAGLLLTDPGSVPGEVRTVARMAVLGARNLVSRAPVSGGSALDVCMTTYGSRTSGVHLALESIAAGTLRPRRLILWLDEPAVLGDLPRPLRRLQRRGLEIRPCENFGPHKKQYPYARDLADGTTHMVTADDDTLYPGDWLAGLDDAVRRRPDLVHGYRAYRIAVRDGGLADYSTWPFAPDDAPSYATFCTGVSGVAYPPAVLEALRAHGERFREAAPMADDVWVHAVAVGAGVRSRQVRTEPGNFPAIPRTQRDSLYQANLFGGRNDLQIAASYGPDDVARVVADAIGAPTDPQETGIGRTR